MSNANQERVFVSRLDGGGFEVSLNGAVITINELRVRPMSNWATPHEVLGKGGSRLALTDRQFVQLTAEYLRYAIQEPIVYVQRSVAFAMSVETKRDEQPADQKVAAADSAAE